MFIHSAKKFAVKKADGSFFVIPKDFVGEIPSDIAKAKIVQLAIKEGSISTPESKKDADIEKAADENKAKVKAAQKKKEEA